MSRLDEIREQLTREDAQYQHVAGKHAQYDERLEELKRLRFQNTEERTEAINLKKLKLSAKDEMERMVRKAAERSICL